MNTQENLISMKKLLDMGLQWRKIIEHKQNAEHFLAVNLMVSVGRLLFFNIRTEMVSNGAIASINEYRNGKIHGKATSHD